MAPKGTKRGSDAKQGSAQKWAKLQREPMFDGINEAIGMSDLPASTRGMLMAMIPGSLGVALEERCPVQVRVVDMIGEVFRGVQARLEKEFEVESESAASIERSEATLAKNVAEASARLAETEAAMESKKTMLTELSGKAVDAVAALQAAESVHSEAQDLVNAIVAERGTYEVGIAENLKVVKEGIFEATLAKAKYEKLAPLLDNLDLDESLRVAVPSVCQRPAAERGAFDQMVLEQLERCLATKVDELGAKVSVEEANVLQRREAVAQAKVICEKLQADQEGLAVELTDTAKARADSVASLEVATSALENFAAEGSRTMKQRDAKKDALENFRNYNVSCYDVLKAKTNVKPAPPMDAVEASEGAEQLQT